MSTKHIGPFLNILLAEMKTQFQLDLELKRPSKRKGFQVEGKLGVLLRWVGALDSVMLLDFSDELYTNMLETMNVSDTLYKDVPVLPDVIQQFMTATIDQTRSSLVEQKQRITVLSPWFFRKGIRSSFAEDSEFLHLTMNGVQGNLLQSYALPVVQHYFNRDRLALFGIPYHTSQQIAISMATYGIITQRAQSIDELELLISKQKTDFVFINETSVPDIYSCLEKLSTHSTNPDILHFIYSERTFNNLSPGATRKLHIAGSVSNKLKPNDATFAFKELLSQPGIKKQDQRREQRYALRSVEQGKVDITIPATSSVISLRLENISENGFCATLPSQSFRSLINPEDQFLKVEIFTPKLEVPIFPEIEICYRHGDQIGAKFLDMKPQSKRSLMELLKIKSESN